MKTNCRFVSEYIESGRSGKIKVPETILLAFDYVERKLSEPGVFIDITKTEKAKELIEKYFGFQLVDWELFVLSLVHCYNAKTKSVVFREFFIMMGRGNGKNGFISGLAWYLTTPYHGINNYNVEIVANSESQATTSFNDICDMCDKHKGKMSKFFSWTKKLITCIKTKSHIRFNTSNSRTKDGKRIGCVIFDEAHEYENFDNINVFTSAFGKRLNERIFYITTDGYVRDGVIDQLKRLANDVLLEDYDIGMLPLIYKIEKEEEAYDPEMWEKANPSLRYFPVLKQELEIMFKKIFKEPNVKQEFFTKRMNWPVANEALAVASVENVEATKKEIPLEELKGKGLKAVAGVDFADIRDFASAGIWVEHEGLTYWITHSWICAKSPDLFRIKAPYKIWAEQGLATIVDEDFIKQSLVIDWIISWTEYFEIACLGIDGFRYSAASQELTAAGFSKENKNLKLIRPSDGIKAVPVMDKLFISKTLCYGDNPLMRWYVYNTKKVPASKVAKMLSGQDEKGNYNYAKIEPKSRKTDGFFAQVAAAAVRDVLDTEDNSFTLPTVYT